MRDSSLFSKTLAGLLLAVLLFTAEAAPAYANSQVGIRLGNAYLSQKVRSLSELRWNKLTRQGWDISCGAAALSTLLTYHNRRQFSEMAITLSILKNTDPALIRKRGGFSLYDLKRFVRAVGLEGLGYGEMTLADLDQFGIPAILPIRINEYDHFVVFRQLLGQHVLIGDPAFGNISIPADRFDNMWQSRIAFYVVSSEEELLIAGQSTTRSPLSPDAMEIAIPNPGYGSRIISRIPATPMTRRPMVTGP